MEIYINPVAYRGASEQVLADGIIRLSSTLGDEHTVIADSRAGIIFFISGGSEQAAIEAIKPGRFYLLLAGYADNAFAAATEVKAWADRNRVATRLHLYTCEDGRRAMIDFSKACVAIQQLNGMRAGLIGNVSHWLVASHFPLELAQKRFGITIEHLPWEMLADYTSYQPSQTFLEIFEQHTPEALKREAGIYAFLIDLLESHRLDAFTLECFEMVKNHDITACLALAVLNNRGIVAGCEGDLVSLVGMMLAKALTSSVPWMANLARINSDAVLFAHCTAPLNLLSSYSINTHFETGKSAAIQGILADDEVTVFRLNQDLTRAFIAPGKIVNRPGYTNSCRTQAEISMCNTYIDRLRNKPLGNHHLIIPGKHGPLLATACELLGINCFES